MVMIEQEAVKKKEMCAMCSMCELPVKDAKSCYIDPVDFTFLCKDCWSNIPTIDEMEALILKIRDNQRHWTDKLEKYKPFLSLAGNEGTPVSPTSVEEVELPEVEELRV